MEVKICDAVFSLPQGISQIPLEIYIADEFTM